MVESFLRSVCILYCFALKEVKDAKEGRTFLFLGGARENVTWTPQDRHVWIFLLTTLGFKGQNFCLKGRQMKAKHSDWNWDTFLCRISVTVEDCGFSHQLQDQLLERRTRVPTVDSVSAHKRLHTSEPFKHESYSIFFFKSPHGFVFPHNNGTYA